MNKFSYNCLIVFSLFTFSWPEFGFGQDWEGIEFKRLTIFGEHHQVVNNHDVYKNFLKFKASKNGNVNTVFIEDDYAVAIRFEFFKLTGRFLKKSDRPIIKCGLDDCTHFGNYLNDFQFWLFEFARENRLSVEGLDIELDCKTAEKLLNICLLELSITDTLAMGESNSLYELNKQLSEILLKNSVRRLLKKTELGEKILTYKKYIEEKLERNSYGREEILSSRFNNYFKDHKGTYGVAFYGLSHIDLYCPEKSEIPHKNYFRESFVSKLNTDKKSTLNEDITSIAFIYLSRNEDVGNYYFFTKSYIQAVHQLAFPITDYSLFSSAEVGISPYNKMYNYLLFVKDVQMYFNHSRIY